MDGHRRCFLNSLQTCCVAMISPGISKFVLIMVLVLAVVFGTRWVIRYHYNQTYAPTDPRGIEGRIRMVGTPPPGAEEGPAATPAPTPVPIKLEPSASSSSR